MFRERELHPNILCCLTCPQAWGTIRGNYGGLELHKSNRAPEHRGASQTQNVLPSKKSPLMSIKIPLKVRLMCSFHFNGLKLEQWVKFQKLGSGAESGVIQEKNELNKTI